MIYIICQLSVGGYRLFAYSLLQPFSVNLCDMINARSGHASRSTATTFWLDRIWHGHWNPLQEGTLTQWVQSRRSSDLQTVLSIVPKVWQWSSESSPRVQRWNWRWPFIGGAPLHQDKHRLWRFIRWSLLPPAQNNTRSLRFWIHWTQRSPAHLWEATNRGFQWKWDRSPHRPHSTRLRPDILGRLFVSVLCQNESGYIMPIS